MSGHRVNGWMLVVAGRADPIGMLEPTLCAGMHMGAAEASKTMPFLVEQETWLLLIPCGSRRGLSTSGGQRLGVDVSF